jgi:hypothetical protein
MQTTTSAHTTLPTRLTLLPEAEQQALERAWVHLEHPSLAARLSSVVGTPIEVGFKLLPRTWYERLHKAVETGLGKALDAAISTLDSRRDQHAHERPHQLYCMTSGAVGGLFGLPGLLVELPVSTSIILRSIAAIARHEGEDLSDPEARLSCVQVFAFGARSEDDDAADTGYYGVRLALAASVSNASRYLLQHGLTSEGAPVLVQLIAAIAPRFGIAVTQKTAAQLLPLVGAAGGAAVNAIFMRHYQDIARAHFTVRRLERTYGEELVRDTYERLGKEPRTPAQ